MGFIGRKRVSIVILKTVRDIRNLVEIKLFFPFE